MGPGTKGTKWGKKGEVGLEVMGWKLHLSLHKSINKFVYICSMIPYAEKYKGIHPGRVLKRELQKRSLKQRPFALSIGEHPQTLNAIIGEKRDLNTALALKIEDILGLQEGSLVHLQAYYDIKREKGKKHSKKPDFTILRKSLFWDTDVEHMDWEKKHKAVIRRVLERGSAQELKEISRFYGPKKVAAVADSLEGSTTTL